MNAAVILNREAGSVDTERDGITPEALREAFAAEGIQAAIELAAPEHLTATLDRAIARRPDAIFLGGGDGTISTAAARLADGAIPLGVLPLGTLNHFARDLGLSTNWREAVHALAHGRVVHVDVGEVNGCVFINNCSIGSYPEAVRKRDRLRREHGRGKWVAMALASFAVFRRLRRFPVCIETPDTTFTLRTPFVFIGNNRYAGQLLDVSLRARLDEGQLSIFTTRAHRHFTILRLAWQTLVRSIDAADALESHLAPEAIVTSPAGQPLPIAVDGELASLTPPLRFRIRPGALPVLSPPPAAS